MTLSASPTRSRFRFGLASLFLLVTLIAAGPVLTARLCMLGESDLKTTSAAYVLIMCAVSAAVSATIHLKRRDQLTARGDVVRATFHSLVISEVLFCVLILAHICLWMPQGSDRAQAIMWSPIACLFTMWIGFPTALSVSYGTGRIVRAFWPARRDNAR